MKKITFFATAMCLGLLLASCNKDEPVNPWGNASAAYYLKSHKDQAKQTVTFNTSALPKTFTFNGGVKITVKPNTFTKGGLPVTGDVTLEVYEMLKPSSIIYSGTNTNYKGGQYLLTDGFINVNAKFNGDYVDETLARNLHIDVPTAKADTARTIVWTGEENGGGVNNDQFAWNNMGDRDFVWKDVNTDQANFPGAGVRAFGGQFSFDFGKLGWVNCDVLWTAGQKTTVKVSLSGKIGQLANYMGFEGEMFVIFCGKGYPVVAQLYTKVDETTVKSYDNSMPVGAKGKVIAFCVKNGICSLASQEITITDNMNLLLDLKQVSKSTLDDAISSLDGYK